MIKGPHTDLVKRQVILRASEGCRESADGIFQRTRINFIRVIAPRPLHHCPAVGNLPCRKSSGDDRRKGRIIGTALLLPPEQYISGDRPLHGLNS